MSYTEEQAVAMCRSVIWHKDKAPDVVEAFYARLQRFTGWPRNKLDEFATEVAKTGEWKV